MENNSLIKVDEKLVEQKKKAWSTMGEAVYKKEIALQNTALSAINDVKYPKAVEDLIDAQEQLKQLKTTKANIENERKQITKIFDDVCARLMVPEKSLDKPISDLSSAIISVKKIYEEQEQKKKQKQEQEAKLIEQGKKHLADLVAFYKTKIVNQVSFAFLYALDNQITPSTAKEYVDKCSLKFKESDFAITYPNVVLQLLTQEEIQAKLQEIVQINPSEFVAEYKKQLTDKFALYDVEYNNKEEAKRIALQKQEQEKNEIESSKMNQQLAASFDAKAEELSVKSDVKALKKVYELDMVDSLENALIIMSAFVANINLIKNEIRVKNYFNLSVEQMGAALCKLKNKDEKFTVTGIVFKQNDKL